MNQEVVLRWGRNAITVALVALLVMQLGLKRSERVEPARLRPAGGYGFVYLVDAPHPDSDGGNQSTLEVRENGRRLGPPHSMHEDIRKLGGGRFSHWGHMVIFSSSDGSDPRSNGRTYTVRHASPRSPLLGLAVLAALLALESRRVVRALAAVEQLHPAWPALAIGLCALAFRIWVFAEHRADTLSLMVKGVPVSDAVWWDTMASAFASGDRTLGMWDSGFGSMRPFSWIFGGAIYALTGPSLVVTKLAHVVLGAIAVVLAFEALRRIAPFAVALIGAAGLAFSVLDARYALSMATEPLGAFLTALLLFLFVLAAQQWKRSLWLAAGLVLGFAILTRPEIMPAVLALPAALAIVLTRRSEPRPGRRQLAMAALLFVAGIAVTVGPWIIRQHIKFGTWQVSGNGPEALYMASTPEYGTWRPVPLPAGMTPRQRIEYFTAKQHESIRLHWRFYIRNAARHAMGTASHVLPDLPLMLALVLLIPGALGAAPNWRRALRVLAPAAVIGVLLWLLPPDQQYWIWIAALGVALVLRAPMLILGAAVAAPIVALGLTAMSDERMTYSLEWSATSLAIWLLAVVLGHESGRRDMPPAWGRAALFVRRAATVAILILVMGLGKAAISFARTQEPHLPVTMTGPEASQSIARALEAPAGAPYLPLRDRLEARTIWPRADYVMHFQAGESVSHWSPLFSQPRAYAFDIIQPLHERYYVMPQGIQPKLGERLVVVGMMVERKNLANSFEIIAAIDGSGRVWHPDPAVAAQHARDMGANREP